MIQKVLSKIFCGTLVTSTIGFDEEVALGIKLYKIELSKFQKSELSLIEFLSPSEIIFVFELPTLFLMQHKVLNKDAVASLDTLAGGMTKQSFIFLLILSYAK
jgi:hypothetical protein